MENTGNKFSDRLKILKLKAGFTWRELAELISVNEASVFNYLKGRVPNAGLLVIIAKKYNVTTDWLLGLDENPEPAAEPEPLPELTVDQHLDCALEMLLDDVSAQAKDELRTMLKSKIYEHRQYLEHNKLLKQIADNARSPAQHPADSNELRKAQGG